MSDVTVAPNASPPPSNEAVINQNPTNAPAPIGSQAPDKPAGETKAEPRPENRREAIQRAFDRARAENPPKPAEARKGHNRPPEDTPDDKPALNLKKRPVDQAASQPRDRAEHGHFAPRQPQPDAGQQQQRPAAPAGAQPQQRQPGAQPSDFAPNRQAPARFNERAKAEWNAAPDSVRSEVYRLGREYHAGFQKYKADHETMDTIRPFHEMATQQGTTLQRALSNYVTMEHKLRTDPIGGMDLIVNNLNLRTQDGRKLTFRDLAWHALNQTPEQQKLIQSSNAQMAQSHQLAQANQRIAGLENHLQQMHHAQRFHATRQGVDQYAATHPRLDELADLIEQEVKLGFDLDTAYRRAEMLRPSHGQARNGNGTAAQTRTPNRSIHGAPDGGPSNGTRRNPNKAVGRREAIANAMKKVGNAL